MGLADREYHRRPHGAVSRLTPVVRWLLWLNGGLFLLDYLVLPIAFGLQLDDLQKPPLVSWGMFTVQTAVYQGRIWEFITFQFLHDSVGHILFNSLGLYFFGPWMERWWGARKFLVYYLLCGCAGAGLFTLLLWAGMVPGGLQTGLIGASAGIYGLAVGVAVIAPDLRVRLLFPPIELSMRQLAIAIMLISVVIIASDFGTNQGGEAGHLGGYLMGFLLMKLSWLLGGPAVKTGSAGRKIPARAKLSPRVEIAGPLVDPEIDRILDKISREGFQSLTQEDRAVLERAARTNDNTP